jgi:NAD(P)-dependent dehydrogenase (short-subunit alcohol dehydrogenase family)
MRAMGCAMETTGQGMRCAVFGASGGIGAALLTALSARGDVARVYAGGRSAAGEAGPKLVPFAFDLLDESSIADACTMIGAPLDLVIVATGRLTYADGTGPEKSTRALSGDHLAEMFAINATGPALIAKHALPLLRKDARGVFAAISARVGSISDNRLGGWHAYRASKAALNMLIRTCAIELARSHPQAIAVTLHPGTVDTALSQPFQRGVAADKLFTADYSAGRMLAVLDGLVPAQSGRLFAWDGAEVPF